MFIPVVMRTSSFVLLLMAHSSYSFKERNVPYDANDTEAAAKDRITYLPGLDQQPNFTQYSGYLEGRSENFKMFYWLVEAKEDAANAPLVLWLNGGPGCSSMSGILSINGPYQAEADGKLGYRKYSWNNIANMLYLEQPAGVGFSYTENQFVASDDDLTSQNAYAALLSFLGKFPRYIDRKFYMTGQGFAGVYVPTIAMRILADPNNGLNLTGLMIGNPSSNSSMRLESELYYLYYHGYVEDDMWRVALENCCGSTCVKRCHFSVDSSMECRNAMVEILDRAYLGLDPYNLFSQCPQGIQIQRRARYLEHYLDGLRKGKLLDIPVSENEEVLCNIEEYTASYLNQKEIREALHVSEKAAAEWTFCNDDILLTYGRIYSDTSPFYVEISNYGVESWLYSGDVDGVVNFLGTKWFINNIPASNRTAYQTWFYRDEDDKYRIGGMFQHHYIGEVPLTFLTVRAAGHSVPRDRPAAAYDLLQYLLDIPTE